MRILSGSRPRRRRSSTVASASRSVSYTATSRSVIGVLLPTARFCKAAAMSQATRTLQPLPPVERVRPGLWSIPVPIPSNSLRYVFVYVFETDRGPYIVDTGWNTDDAFAALSDGLKQVGTDIADVQGALVTHIHPDHYGLA